MNVANAPEDQTLSYELVNPLSILSETKRKAQGTVMNHFRDYLIQKVPGIDAVSHTAIEDLFQNKQHLVTEDLIGKFCDYLMNVKKVKSGGTMESYLSHVKDIITRRMGADHAVVKGKMFTDLRRTLKKNYQEKGYRTQNSIPMTMDDLKQIAKVLFNEKTDAKTGLMNRTALIFQWQLLGRVGEIAELEVKDLRWTSGHGVRTVSIMLSRSKTISDQTLLIFPHPDNYLICPIHSLASWLAIYGSTERLFTYSAKGASAITNAFIKEATKIANKEKETVTKDLSSHSLRSGGATYLTMARDVNENDIGRRGNWSVNAQKPQNIYMQYTQHNDAIVGRVLSEWEGPYLQTGGNCLIFDDIGGTMNDLEQFSIQLFGVFDITANLRECLTINLLIHYNAVKADCDDHLIILRMEAAVKDKEQLHKWSTELLERYRALNVFQPVKEVDVHTPILSSFVPLIESQQKLTIQSNIQQNQLAELNKMMKSVVEIQQLLLMKIEQGGTPTMVSVPNGVEEQLQAIPSMFLQKNPTPSPNFVAPKDLDAGKLFELWFTQELYLQRTRESGKYGMETYKMVVSHSKCLLPRGTVIKSKPSDIKELQSWQLEIAAYSKIVHERWIQLRQQHENLKKAPTKVSVWTAKKLIPIIKRESFDVFQLENVCDNATPPDMKWENKKHRQVKH